MTIMTDETVEMATAKQAPVKKKAPVKKAPVAEKKEIDPFAMVSIKLHQDKQHMEPLFVSINSTAGTVGSLPPSAGR